MKPPDTSSRPALAAQRLGVRAVASAGSQGVSPPVGNVLVRPGMIARDRHSLGASASAKANTRGTRPTTLFAHSARSNDASGSSNLAGSDGPAVARVAAGSTSPSAEQDGRPSSNLATSPRQRIALPSGCPASTEAAASPARSGAVPGPPSVGNVRKSAEEDLRQRIRLLAQRGSSLASGADGSRPKPPPAMRCTSPPLPSPHPAASSTSVAEATSPTAYQPSASVSTAANTRTSSPGLRSPGSPGDRSVQGSVQGQLDFKARQMVELRAQISRWELYGGTFPGEPHPAEPSYPDPERTGPRSPASSVGVTSALTLPLEEELAWTVKQMEVHRRQIQEHQWQLSALEKRHAEIVSTISSVSCGSSVSGISPGMDRTYDEALEQSGLYGAKSATSSVLDSRVGITQQQHQQQQQQQPEPLATDDKESSRADVLSSTHNSVSGAQKLGGTTLGVDADAMAAAQARLGLRVFSSRPTSAGSSRSGLTPVAAGMGRNVFMSKNPRPGSASSISSASSATLAGRALPSWETASMGECVDRSRGFNFSPGSGDGFSPGSRSAVDEERSSLRPRANSGSVAMSDVDTASEDAWQARHRDDDSNVADPADKSQEAALVGKLLKQFSARRPMRVAFVPLNTTVDGEGHAYLHGSLEVRLILPTDSKKLQVRVPNTTGTHGRPMDIDDFVTRAEAIAARRLSRPNPIAEEVEQINAASPIITSPHSPNGHTVGDGSPGDSLHAILGPRPGSPSSGTPWKSLFKSHWDSR